MRRRTSPRRTARDRLTVEEELDALRGAVRDAQESARSPAGAADTPADHTWWQGYEQCLKDVQVRLADRRESALARRRGLVPRGVSGECVSLACTGDHMFRAGVRFGVDYTTGVPLRGHVSVVQPSVRPVGLKLLGDGR